MQLLAKFQKILYMRFRVTLTFRKLIEKFFDTRIVASIDKEC